jgi:hypothetical protein
MIRRFFCKRCVFEAEALADEGDDAGVTQKAVEDSGGFACVSF